MRLGCRIGGGTLLWLALPMALVAQGKTPLRFGVEFARATPTGAFARVAGPANGFLGWLALPLSRTSPLGIGAEFSVLTLPARQVRVPIQPPVSDLTVDLRSTLTFVGVGPRIEHAIGPLSLGASVMPGFTRVIVDLTGLFTVNEQARSVAVSSSEYAAALKGGVVATLPLYRGIRGTALGAAAGADYTISGRAPFPDQHSFGYDELADRLILARPEVALSHWRLHAGMSVEF
ncbi:MAG TPA: hypothetical protein VFN22_03155 [Gemmatimonadales bacterium]|nr:hypothetical protein [Gemmatimonadales bacterium]